MKAKVICIENWLKKKYRKTSKQDEEEKLHLCDRCRKQERWRKRNENHREGQTNTGMD